MSSPTDDLVEILFSAVAINNQVQDLGRQISHAYEGKDPVLITILKGAVVFLVDLMRAITIPHTIDFMAISSYGVEGTSGIVRIVKDLDQSITGRHVLVVEDVVDRGTILRGPDRGVDLVRVLEPPGDASAHVDELLLNRREQPGDIT